MGRELRRKQAKKEGKSLEREIIVENQPIKKLIMIICILTATMAIICLLTATFVTNELAWPTQGNKEETTNNVANTILASDIFKQAEEEYYVYFYDYTDEEENVSSLVSSKLSSSKVYRVDTSSALNAKYVGSPSNKKAKKLEELKIVAPTVIKISNGAITGYYEKLEITNNL